MKKTRFTVLGGDLRSVFAYRFLIDSGCNADTFLLENASLLSEEAKSDSFPLSDCYILGLPASNEHGLINSPLSDRSLSVKDFFALVPKSATVFGGLLPDEFLSAAKEKGIRTEDYFSSEELQIKNSVPTAEGALEIAIRETPMTIAESKALIIGYGRIAKALIPMLKALGSRVSVCTRNPNSLTWCSVSGCEPVNMSELEAKIGAYDIIFNTAPSRIIEGPILDKINPGSLIIDLASRPGGVDLNQASLKGLRVIWALGLPGKCAPITAGKIIAGTVLSALNGR